MRLSARHEGDDGRSILSNSSVGSLSSFEIKNASNGHQFKPKNRKFAASIGRLGAAKEVRDAISKLINMRVPPLSEPLDFEGFITEFGTDLESDPLRELLLFPRDDIALCKPCTEETKAAAMVSDHFGQKTESVLAREALQHFSTPATLIKFNYESFFGDCEKYIASSGLEELVFETNDFNDTLKEKEGSAPVGILREGYLLVDLHKEGFVRNLKGRRRRYCVIRRTADGKLIVELFKQQDATANKGTFTVKSAHLRTSNKQRTTILELIMTADGDSTLEQCLLFPSDSVSDVKSWFVAIDQVLKDLTPKPAEQLSPEPNAPVLPNETGDPGQKLPLGRRPSNTVESLLKPPLVKRRNVFCLYENVEPMCRPVGEPTALLEELDSEDKFKSCSNEFAVVPQSGSSDVPPNLSGCHSTVEEMVRVDISCDHFQMHIRSEEFSDQIEPIFPHIFLFDAQSGQRVSEEIPLTIATNEFARQIPNSDGKYKVCVFGKDDSKWKLSMNAAKIDPNVYLVIRFERLLSGCPPDIYAKAQMDKKQFVKNSKLLSSAFQCLNDYRTIFAWTTRSLQTANLNLFANSANEMPIYRCDGHLTDADLKKYLSDFSKLQKSGKLGTIIPNAHIRLNIDVRTDSVDLPLKYLDPVVGTDFFRSTGERPVINFQSFSDRISSPLRSCTNFLYIYPQSLAYGSQKAFSRARNITVGVSFVRMAHKDQYPHNVVRLNFMDGPMAQTKLCTIQYHEPNPSFSDEIKIELPINLTDGDHLLFTFSHVSLSAAQKSPNSNLIEQNVGYAWLSLLGDGCLTMTEDVEDFELPVASTLSPDYFRYDTVSLASRKSNEGTVKWVENGKPLFRVRLRLLSAFFSTNSKIQRFFQSTANVDCEPEQNLLTDLPFDRILPHLFVLLNRLFGLFPQTADSKLSVPILRILISLLEQSVSNGKKRILREFVRFHCAVGGECNADSRPFHEALMEAISTLLGTANDEAPMILRHLWLLLDVCAKSMLQMILLNGSHKYSRRRRFSPFTSEAMDTMFSTVVDQIIQLHQRFTVETRTANVALAFFAKNSLNMADRGTIFALIHETVKKYDLSDSGLPRRYKLEFLQILASHEHWLPLNLPVLFDLSGKPLFGFRNQLDADSPTGVDALNAAKSSLRSTNILSRIFSQFLPLPLPSSVNSSKKSTLNPFHFHLSKEYCKTHFLAGLLLQEFAMALNEPRAYRRLVITLLRNLLLKHSGDVRYDTAAAQSRIAILYSPLIRIILDHIDDFEMKTRRESRDINDNPKRFDYVQTTARSVSSKDQTLVNPLNESTATQRFSQFAEKLDQDEERDLVLCTLHLLHNLPKSAIVTLCFAPPSSVEGGDSMLNSERSKSLPILHILRVSLRLFKCTYYGDAKQNGSTNSKKGLFATKEPKQGNGEFIRKTFVQDSHLAQEVALIVLDVCNALTEHMASRWADGYHEHSIFNGILKLNLELIGDWPEGVRLNALNSLGMFVELFANTLPSNEGADALAKLCQRLLILLNSRLERVQAAAAALLHLLIRQGFNSVVDGCAKQPEISEMNSQSVTAEWLGNPGVQITTALAHLLGQNELSPDCPRFEYGLSLFETLTTGNSSRRNELFKYAAQDLANQLRDILKATISIAAARDDPIRLAELHVQLADSYRGSPTLRCAWFDTLTQIHINDRWFSEAAVCLGHCVAIIAKQLSLRDSLKFDFSLLDAISETIAIDEHANEMPIVQNSGFTLESLTTKVEETMRVLVQSERYEAMGPLCRLVIPIYEQQNQHKALTSIYAELHQAYSRAAEIQSSGKRHLGSYFRVILHSPLHFRSEDKSEWIYREPGLTSLAEACERMIQLFRRSLRTEHIRFLTEHDVDIRSLDPAVAHIQLTHVEPFLNPDPTQQDFELHLANTQKPEANYLRHSNISRFFYERAMVEPQQSNSNERIPEQARLSLKRVFLTAESTFPNTRRCLRVIKHSEYTLNPLMLACENLQRKASQIQSVLSSGGVSGIGPVDRCKLGSLDLKGLQCLLQGSVSPTVNVGVLVYAETFTTETQRTKYGPEGIDRLKNAFKIFMAQLGRALSVNEAAIGQDQAEYHTMLKNSFDGMLERLTTFFDGENFYTDSSQISASATPSNTPLAQPDSAVSSSRNSTYILESISGISRP